MSKAYSIGQLAKIVGVSVSTLRRWDKEKLLTPSIITEGKHRRYTEDAVLQIINKRFKVDNSDVSLPHKEDVSSLGSFRRESSVDYAGRVFSGVKDLGSLLDKYQGELSAISALRALTSNPVMVSLLDKEYERVNAVIGDLTGDLSDVAVDILHTIKEHYPDNIVFDTFNEDKEVLLGGEMAELVDYLLFNNPARVGIKYHAKGITYKKALHVSLNFAELLRRIDFYYTSAGISLKAIARKKNLIIN